MNMQMHFRTAVLLFLATAFFLLGDDAEAQQRPDPLVASAAWTPPLVGATVAQDAPPSFERMLLGSALGTAAGAAVGTGVAFLVYSTRTGEAYLGPLPELLFIGTPILLMGTTLGTYIGSRREANPWITAAGSVLGVGLGLGAGIVVGNALEAGEYAGGAVGVALAITVPATVAWATTR